MLGTLVFSTESLLKPDSRPVTVVGPSSGISGQTEPRATSLSPHASHDLAKKPPQGAGLSSYLSSPPAWGTEHGNGHWRSTAAIALGGLHRPGSDVENRFRGPVRPNLASVPNGHAGVSIQQPDGSTDVEEGGATDSYSVVLDSQPTSTVVVSVSADAQVASDPPTLTFTTSTWSSPQTVTVTAVADSVVEGAHTGRIKHIATGAGYDGLVIPDVLANVTDNDTPGVTVDESFGSTRTTEGSRVEELGLPGRQWSLALTADRPDLDVSAVQWEWTVLGAGFLITLLLAAYLINTTRHAAKIEAMASELSTTNQDLEREIIERQKAEKARFETLSQAAVAMAHHVRNSVTPILGVAQLYNEDRPASGKTLRQVALDQGRKISAVIDALIEISESDGVATVDTYGPDSPQMLDMEPFIKRSLEKYRQSIG